MAGGEGDDGCEAGREAADDEEGCVTGLEFGVCDPCAFGLETGEPVVVLVKWQVEMSVIDRFARLGTVKRSTMQSI